MPAARGRKLGQVLAVLAVLAAGALPAGASIPRPGQRLEPDPEALLAAAREPAPAPPQAEAAVPGDRFDLLAPAAVDRLLFTGRPARLHLFAELETRVRASDLLSLAQPLAFMVLIPEIASGDRETGLYYAKARYYDPELGLFLTQDPFEGVLDTPPSLHRYLYAYQNPTVYTDPTGWQNVFTPNEVLQDSAELQRLQQQLVDARLAAKKAFEGAGKTSDPEKLRRVLSRPLEIQGRIGALQERLQKAEQFYGEVVMVIEDAESVDAQRELLQKFLHEKKHVGFERSVRVTTALLGPSECDIYCKRFPDSTDEEIQLFRSMESFAANTALFGLFELGVLEYVDDAVRVTALVDDAAVLEDGAVRTAASLDDVASLGDDLGRGARRTPSSGPLKNASGNLDEAAQARRTQPHGASVEGGTPRGQSTVIGKVKDLENLRPGENTLLKHLPDQGSPKANWTQNSGVLRRELGKGQPIRDASVDPVTGELIEYPGSFLNAERNLLRERGWTYDPATNLWSPPQ